MERALEILAANPPDVFNHNIETVPDLYRNVRPGADYQWSLNLLKNFKAQHPDVPTKSGIMLGLGETLEQMQGHLRDLRAHDVDMITIGQYLQPTAHHHPVLRYWTPEDYKALEDYGYAGLQPRRVRPDGALVLPRRPAGRRRGLMPAPRGSRSRHSSFLDAQPIA
jgi:lipoic acid synthetase